jgi:hypothetical protein
MIKILVLFKEGLKKTSPLLVLISFTFSLLGCSDTELPKVETIKTNWITIADEILYLNISETGIYEIGDIRFEILWEKEMEPNQNLGYLGGITDLKIFKEGAQVNCFENLVDPVGLGEINFEFFDFNLDGHLDFRFPIAVGQSRWDQYFIYSERNSRFEHLPSWDYLKIHKVNKLDKLIITHSDGYKSRELFEVKGDSLVFVRELRRFPKENVLLFE